MMVSTVYSFFLDLIFPHVSFYVNYLISNNIHSLYIIVKLYTAICPKFPRLKKVHVEMSLPFQLYVYAHSDMVSANIIMHGNFEQITGEFLTKVLEILPGSTFVDFGKFIFFDHYKLT